MRSSCRSTSGWPPRSWLTTSPAGAGVIGSHANIVWNSVNVLVATDLAADEVTLVVAPLFHTAGLNMTCLPTLLKGGRVVLLDAGYGMTDASPGILDITGVSMSVNYGLSKVRCPSPVPVGAKFRLHGAVGSVEEVRGNGVQMRLTFTVEVEGSDEPACVAQAVYRHYA
ncbi:AMP-binding protein [Streptomyces sp. SYSU K21746]